MPEKQDTKPSETAASVKSPQTPLQDSGKAFNTLTQKPNEFIDSLKCTLNNGNIFIPIQTLITNPPHSLNCSHLHDYCSSWAFGLHQAVTQEHNA